MRSNRTGAQKHELVPIIGYFVFTLVATWVAALPVLLQVVEDWLARVVVAGGVIVFFIDKRASLASFVAADKAAFFVLFGHLVYSFCQFGD